jgi:hypothetical protein
MVSTELSDKKPGVITAFRVLLAFLAAGLVVTVILLINRNSGTYDTDRVAKRYENLQKLNTENTKKSAEYAVLDKTKGVYQLPISEAIALTAKDLSAIKPHAAYPVATPAPAVPATPAVVKP